jgi:hypothetical protein
VFRSLRNALWKKDSGVGRPLAQTRLFSLQLSVFAEFSVNEDQSMARRCPTGQSQIDLLLIARAKWIPAYAGMTPFFWLADGSTPQRNARQIFASRGLL